MLNVGGGGQRQGPPCPRADDRISQVSPTTGEKSMAPNAQHGDKIRNGYLTPAPGLTPRNITRAFSRSPW